MSSTINLSSTTPPTKSVENTSKPTSTPEQQSKASLNVSILESTKVAIGAKNQPMALLLNTAIDKINTLLTPESCENAIQKAADANLDVTPEATASRIVGLSTAFYNAFKEQSPGDESSAVLDKFMATISEGIDQGFKEARDILEGLDVLKGDIASDIDTTYDLIQEKLSAFAMMIKADQ